MKKNIPVNFHTSRTPFNKPIKSIKPNLPPLIRKESVASKKGFIIKKQNNEKKFIKNNIINVQALAEKELYNPIDDYQIKSQIGIGAYGVVKSAVCKNTGKHVAIKIYEKSKLISRQRKSCVEEEIRILKELNHPNIVRLYDTIDTPKHLYLIMELIKGRSLLSYVRSLHEKVISEDDAIVIFKQILSGIQYCHSKGISHRDIKMDNIILDNRFNVKIIDFGFATRQIPNEKLTTYCGTPLYMAPEVVNKEEYLGPPSDMWSLGVLLFVMLCGNFPFNGNTDNEVYANVTNGRFSVPICVSGLGRNLISKLLDTDAERRITAVDAAKDIFLNLNN